MQQDRRANRVESGQSGRWAVGVHVETEEGMGFPLLPLCGQERQGRWSSQRLPDVGSPLPGPLSMPSVMGLHTLLSVSGSGFHVTRSIPSAWTTRWTS